MSDILYSKLRLEVPQALDGEDATITSERGNARTVELSSPITDIILPGMEKYNVKAGITDENVAFGYGQIQKVEAKGFDTLENESWANIADVIKSGKFAQVASIGDTKTIKINNKTYTAEVVAINDGTGYASQWYPANTVDFICKELYETAYRYNSSDTNSGGFPSSEIKNTLNNTIYPLLPTDLKDVIIEKSHSYQAGSYGSSWSSSMTTLATKLWLPTHYEIAGTTYQYAPGETASNNKAYTLASKVKNLNGQTSATIWWLGSPDSRYSYAFWRVIADGSLYSGGASYAYGVPVCFRIG